MNAATQMIEFPQFGSIECRAKAERTHRAIATEQLIWLIRSPSSPHAQPTITPEATIRSRPGPQINCILLHLPIDRDQ
jgi:hypothetical protein